MSDATPRPTPKVLSWDDLLRTRAALRGEGKRLVQCHGCFDIVHPGHIRHLRQAKSLGDVLLVSITGDSGISKGVGRPLIPEELRADNLAALDFVDYVYIEHRATAVEMLSQLQPDIYIKGKEYESNRDARFLAERQAVERAGGRVVFSSGDVVFSSTALIAALEQSVDPFHARLAQLVRRDELQGERLFQSLSRVRGQRVVIVGESILDTYVLCDRPDVAGESPILTLRPLEARHYDGGAAVIARHAASLGAAPILITPMPQSEAADEMRRRLLAEGIDVRTLPVRSPIPEKQRFLVGQQKVLKVDLVEPLLLDGAQHQSLIDLTRDAVREHGGVDACIVADFGLGLFSPQVLHAICETVRPHARVLSGDVSGKRSNLRAMHHMDLLCPSEIELREALRLHSEGLTLAVWKLLEETKSRSAIITLGADGLVAFDKLPGLGLADPLDDWTTRLKSEHVPALCPLAIDPLGCGDSLLTSATLALAAGAPLVAAAFLGACAASIQVQRLGNSEITATDLRQQIVRVHNSHLTFAGNETIRSRGLSPTYRRAG
jgi:rfaE bifunctional protein nucleotidyltransferase chain/domain